MKITSALTGAIWSNWLWHDRNRNFTTIAADIVRQAATLCFGLVKNHPWRGGNKRTATHLMRVFLILNGFNLNYEIEEMLEMVLAVEADKWKVDEIENWLRVRVKQIQT